MSANANALSDHPWLFGSREITTTSIRRNIRVAADVGRLFGNGAAFSFGPTTGAETLVSISSSTRGSWTMADANLSEF